MPEKEFIAGMEFNRENPLLNNLRPCKSIFPKNSRVSGGEVYSQEKPRIVKSNFKVPANWQVLKEYQDGQIILDENGETIEKESFGVRQILIHVCKKPHNCLSDMAGGFYAQWKPTDREIRKEKFGF